MKTIIFTSAFFIAGLFAVYSCGDRKPVQVKPKTLNIDSIKSMDQSPLDTAIANITNYNRHWALLAKQAGYEDSIPIRSYLINSIDLINLLGVEHQDSIRITFQSVRVYLGLNYLNHFKLYMTPVGINGLDSILVNSKGKFVYDLNAPCPSTCGDPTSPLYIK